LLNQKWKKHSLLCGVKINCYICGGLLRHGRKRFSRYLSYFFNNVNKKQT
jgi:hypothetical protein